MILGWVNPFRREGILGVVSHVWEKEVLRSIRAGEFRIDVVIDEQPLMTLNEGIKSADYWDLGALRPHMALGHRSMDQSRSVHIPYILTL